MTATTLPGYRVTDAAQAPAEDGLRNDVAAFLGSTARGPVGVPVRVTSRQDYARVFGAWGPGSVPRALAAYYANGGEVAWVVRAGRDGAHASARLELGDGAGTPGVPWTALELRATSPGTWADGTEVRLTLRAFGLGGAPDLDVSVEVPGEAPVRRAGLTPGQAVAVLTGTGLVAVLPENGARDEDSTDQEEDPTARRTIPAVRTRVAVLRGGAEPTLDVTALREAIAAQADVDEVAMVCLPGLALLADAEHDELLADLADSCAAGQDRIAVVSLPCPDGPTVAAWHRRLADALPDPSRRRAVAAYGGWLRAADLTGTGSDRYPVTDPVGHVCGVVSRLDRERGSGWSPANVLVADAVDVAHPLPAALQGLVMDHRVNLLRPRVGGGLEVWGARTLDPGAGRHLAHRRLVHRVVRAVRRVCEPMVFDTDDALLRFAVARAVSGVLMEAFRSGALAGETPDEAYRVRCDETTTTAEDQDAGRVVCLVEVAPATPMEFITLRLTLGSEGLLEVVEQ